MTAFMYVIGQPGSGKSTLVSSLTQGDVALPTRFAGLDMIEYVGAGVAEIGRDREKFRGTDALGMTIIGPACDYLAVADGPMMAEGDRLAVDRFFDAVTRRYELELVLCWAPDAVCAERRRARGSTQDEAWVRGRKTKVERLWERWKDRATNALMINTTADVELQIAHLMASTVIGGHFDALDS